MLILYGGPVLAYAIDMGISKEAASFLLSIVGVTNTVGRHILCSYRQAEVFILELFLCSRLEISPSGH